MQTEWQLKYTAIRSKQPDEFYMVCIENKGAHLTREEFLYLRSLINDVEVDGEPKRAPAVVVAEQKDAPGWVVANGQGKRWRFWGDTGPEWTTERDKALRFARRCDAEAFAREDEDAWLIQPIGQLAAAPAAQVAEPKEQSDDSIHQLLRDLKDLDSWTRQRGFARVSNKTFAQLHDRVAALTAVPAVVVDEAMRLRAAQGMWASAPRGASWEIVNPAIKEDWLQLADAALAAALGQGKANG